MSTLFKRLWLDDERPAPEGWHWAKTADEAIAVLETGLVIEASLDHDLGGVYLTEEHMLSHKERTGYDVALWMAEYEVWPPEGVTVHSWNSVGAANIAAVVNRYSPYRCKRQPAKSM